MIKETVKVQAVPKGYEVTHSITPNETKSWVIGKLDEAAKREVIDMVIKLTRSTAEVK